jgi:hypothetical protein
LETKKKYSVIKTKVKCKFYILIISFFCFINCLTAETTYGYCSVKESRSGKDLYQIFGNTYFESKPIDLNFHEILLEVYVHKNFVYDDQQILAKAKLYNINGKIIGVALVDFTPFKYVTENDSMIHFQLSGFLSSACINPSSVPEIDLNKILSFAKQNAGIELFNEYLSKFNFQKDDTDSIYQSYIIFEPNFLLQKKDPRILIIFYRYELIAIFYSRSVIAKLYDSIEMGKEYKLIYNSKFTENTKSEMIQIFKKKMNMF